MLMVSGIRLSRVTGGRPTLAARARQGKSLSLTGTYAHPEDAPGASRWAAPKALLCITFSANGCAGLDPRQ